MGLLKPLRNSKGQALNEMLIVIPLLLILAASLSQLAILIREKVQFEHACGLAVRQYALGQFPKEEIANALWNNLGAEQKYFDKGSVNISAQDTKTLLGRDFRGQFVFLRTVMKEGLFNYGGGDWTITIRYRSFPLLGVLLPNGILFQTRLSVLRHPA